MPETTPADEIRQAAATLRETAERATPGPWKPGGIGDYGWSVQDADASGRFGVETEDSERGRADAGWIALMHPGVAEPLAALLEHCAKNRDAAVSAAESVSDKYGTLSPDEIDHLTPYALPVARAINGTQP